MSSLAHRLILFTTLLSLSSCGFLNRNQYCVNGSSTCAGSSDSASSTSAPVPNGSLAVANKTREGLTISWPSASDARTPQSNLTYQLVYSEKLADLDTVAKALNMVKLGLALPLRQGNTTETLSQLRVGHSYYFTVVVTNQDGNSSIYPPQQVVFTDDEPPSVIQKLYATNLSPTSVGLVWPMAEDNATLPQSLQYRVVSSSNESDFASPATAAALTGTAIKVDWTANLTSTTLTGLTPSVPYLVAILVKDNAGNISMIGPVLTQTLDSSAPTIGAFDTPDLTSTSIALTWSAATDDVTPSSDIAYRVAASTTLSDVDTISKVQNATAPILINDWEFNRLSTSITGISSGATVYVSVIVKDVAGNPAIYGPIAIQTLDTIAPTIGGTLSSGFITTNGFTIGWPLATDNVTHQEALQYRVVYASSASAINTVGKIAALTGPQVAMDWSVNRGKVYVQGLRPYTQYYVAIAVRDSAGNMSAYTPQAIRTIDESAPTPSQIFAFNLTSAGYSITWLRTKDNEVDSSQISYRLIYSSNPNDVGSVDRAAALTGPGVVMDWTLDIQAATTFLQGSSVFYFTVMTKDPSNNISMSPVFKFATPDTTPPTVGGVITTTPSTSSTWWTVNWPAATDDVSSQAALTYFIALSTASTNIDTVQKALSQYTTLPGASGCFAEGNSFRNRLSSTAYGSGNQDCYASVIVRDEAGNMSLYPPVKVFTYTPIVLPPTFSNSIFAGSSGAYASVSWGPALTYDGSTPGYRLVKATTAAAIDTISEVDAISGVDVIQDYPATTTKQSISGLTAGTTYYFSVVVKDGAGRETLSGPVRVVMPTAPTVGTAITVNSSPSGSLLATQIGLAWGVASDAVTPTSSLQYRLVTAHDQTLINTAAKITACALPCMVVSDWTSNLLSNPSAFANSNLDNFFAVAVRNNGFLASAYTPLEANGPTMPVALSPTTGEYELAYMRSQSGLFTYRAINQSISYTNPFGSYVDMYQAQMKVTSDGGVWALVQEQVCPSPYNWVRSTQIYKRGSDATSWAITGNRVQGSGIHCTANTLAYSSAYLPALFEVGNDIAVIQNESNGSIYQGALRTNSRTNPVAAWGASVGNLPQLSSIPSTYTVNGVAYVFYDASTPKVYRITADNSEPAVLTATDLNFDVTVPNGTILGEPAGQALTRIALDTVNNILYVIYIDPNNSKQARVRKLVGSTWSDTGLTTTGAAGNVSLLYANGLLYALYMDYATGRGNDAVLKSFNGTTWTTVSASVFGQDVLSPMMRWNSITMKVDVSAVSGSFTRPVISF